MAAVHAVKGCCHGGLRRWVTPSFG